MSSEKRNSEKGCAVNFNREQELVRYCWFGACLGKDQKSLCSELMHVASRNNVLWKNGGFVTEIFRDRSAVLWKIVFFFPNKKRFPFPSWGELPSPTSSPVRHRDREHLHSHLKGHRGVRLDVRPSQQNSPVRNFPIRILSFELKVFAPKIFTFKLFSKNLYILLVIFFPSPVERTANHFPLFLR